MSWKSLANRAFKQAVRLGVREGKAYLANRPRPASRPARASRPTRAAPAPPASSGRAPAPSVRDDYASGSGLRGRARSYPGDFDGTLRPSYSPNLDGDADPGEVVWGWVPFEEDHSQGKDRPVLIVGHDGDWLLALMLTSKDRAPGEKFQVHRDEHGNAWMNIGAGAWDADGRQSEVRLDRIIRLDQSAVRREGAVLDRAAFDRAIGNMRHV